MKKTIALFLSLCLFCLAFAGCGKDMTAQTTESGQTTEETETAETESQKDEERFVESL